MILPQSSLQTMDDQNMTSNVLSALSSTELEFIRLACHPAEFEYEEIATMMDKGIDELESYYSSISEKFNIRTRAGLVLFAFAWRIEGMHSVLCA